MKRLALLALLLLAGCAAQRGIAPPAPANLLGVTDTQLDPAHWIARQRDATHLRMNADAIAALNARMFTLDPAVHAIDALPATLRGDDVRKQIETLSAPPQRTLFDATGERIPASRLTTLQRMLALDTVPASITPRFALVTQRADLRTFPTTQRVFSAPADLDIDRFQENALFPGTPVAIEHQTRDGAWSFVASTLYSAWIETRFLAVGARETVLDYSHRQPAIVVTGASVRTVSTREQPQVSNLQLDMGVRLPLRRDLPPDTPVNGQHPLAAWTVELPIRDPHGTLALVPALLPKTADVALAPLPLTEANLLQQSFKFLGERYGWGHADGARDCSGFVSEVYRSVGVTLPRNTGDQARSPALDRVVFDATMTHTQRIALLEHVDVGDLIYIPGHVMLVIGREHGQTFVIHDITGVNLRNTAGTLQRVPLNAVSVTPFESLLADDGGTLIDRITSIQRVR